MSLGLTTTGAPPPTSDRGRTAPPRPAAPAADTCRVLLVDDSAVARGVMSRILTKAGDITVVAAVSDGNQAVEANRRHQPDVIILDIEMPVMDGLTALPLLLAQRPQVRVLIASQLTARGAEIGLRALAAGAADTILKPGTTGSASLAEFERDVVAKVRALGRSHRLTSRPPGVSAPEKADGPGRGVAASASRPAATPASPVLRAMPPGPFSALAIGSSTGGPQALFRALGGLKGRSHLPIFITQHMPATFTTILAQHITRMVGLETAEGVDGEAVTAGRVYLAPGDNHMTVVRVDDRPVIRLTQTAPENFCRPSVDPMLRSLTEIYGRQLLCVILTGMGQDGLLGAQGLVAKGGAVVAQDAATSVVWGMPGAVATAGLCSAVLPIGELETMIRERAGTTRGAGR